MKILAIETSGFEGSVAIAGDGIVIAERMLPTSGRRHAQTLVSEVDLLLRSYDMRVREIDAVAVSIGPGSFTGLRVGLVFAKTFAWANDAALVAVNTLQAAAQNITDSAQTVTVISDAQRNEVFLNGFCRNSDSEFWQPINGLQIVPVDSLCVPERSETLWTGPGLKKFAELLAEENVADSSLWNPTAAHVALLGGELFDRGETADIRLQEPLYIRRSYAEEKRAP